jgi:CBS domain containing-hemolysin-like protein
MSGLVVDFLGEVPTAGTDVSINGLKIEVLEADRKKIHSMRISREGESSRKDSSKASQDSKSARASVQVED